MPSPFESRVVDELTVEHLRGLPRGNLTELTNGVARRLLSRPHVDRFHAARGDPAYEALFMDVQAVCWRLVARGALVWGMNSSNENYPTFRVTDLGARLLEWGTEHPVHPDFVARVTRDCPNLPSEVPARLEDAHDCFNNGLYRASVVMLRLAYEHMIRVIYDEHDLANHVPGKLKPGNRPTAGTLLDGLVHVLGNIEDPPEGVINMATHIADVIRQDGNAAVHDWARDFADAAEVEELLILAGRNVRRLWILRDRLP